MSEYDDYQQLVRTVFSNDQGRKLINVWQDNYVKRPSFHYENTPEQTAYRDAERMFVQQIIDLLGED